MNFLAKLEESVKTGKIPSKLSRALLKFYFSYAAAVTKNGHAIEEYEAILKTLIDLVGQQLVTPFIFEPFHERVREPFDYYQFGLDFLRPLIIFEQSKVRGMQHVMQMEEQLKRGENVILLANHQTEPDPQAISLLLEKSHPKLVEEMIFVAGHRVINDPLTVPFSMGRNLLCIYSKRYIEHPPEKKQEKLLHNQRTMKQMSQLLGEGGKCVYVAPSGGRDRPDAAGVVEVAKFDSQSIEMFWLMSQQAGHITHFYPLTLVTYHLLPPPNSIQKELGEPRQAQCAPVHLSFGKEIDMENFPGKDLKDKRQKRVARADYIWDLVRRDYALLQDGQSALH